MNFRNKACLLWPVVAIGGLLGGIIGLMPRHYVNQGSLDSLTLLVEDGAPWIGGMLGGLVVGLTLGGRRRGYTLAYALVGWICGLAVLLWRLLFGV